MAASPTHVTLGAATVATVTLDDAYYNDVEVLNVDGAAAVYYTVDNGNPTVEGNGCNVLPAAIGGLTTPCREDGTVTVKLISAGTPKVSVRGIREGRPRRPTS
jgi:hypothetical protein